MEQMENKGKAVEGKKKKKKLIHEKNYTGMNRTKS